jgi:tRNA (pseudouridine54-N1)-methyltransferase
VRRFVVLGHTQPPAGPIPLQDAPGAGGRWDLLARCVTSGLLVSHGVREDAEVVLVLVQGPRVVRATGRAIRRLNPDERSTLALLSKALEAQDIGAHESQTLDGLTTSRRGLEDVLQACAREGPVVWLREDAETPLDGQEAWSAGATFVLSDHRDPTPDEASVIGRHATATVSLGPVALQADQCITVVHNRLDRWGLPPASRAPRARLPT